ncbi:hypothetical protein ILFOPFJJ_06190 [Ensifer psoraleae]|uniref:hypothetical protein n=1 Tax=Sinorhizobium psoraleae TaxID=520838 RepID=UPI001568A77B|nr:hypothetical protein [Sinorhizobium psoraleae]NRP75267.1 hypothetical protein [Sinorhizobium psoraleae]
MADSDNSRTLSTVTLGDFHSFVAASLPTFQELTRTKQLSWDGCDDDPALALWHQWCSAWQRLGESSFRQQRLERSLFPVAGSRTYSEALEAEDRASIVEEQAAQTLWETPAVSVAGAAAKLHAAVTKWQPSPNSPEEPWPQIRGVIADLLKIDLVLGATDRQTTPEPD